MVERCHVAVVGAGPAGAATALRLARRGLRVTLLERSWLEEARVGESLAPSVQPLIRELGLWDAFLALSPVASHGTKSVWGSDGVESHAHVMTVHGCGWHVDRQLFDHMFASAAAAAGAELRLGTDVRSCERRDGGWFLDTGRGGVQADVVVDASGRAAALSQKLGGRRMLFDRLLGLGVVLEGQAAADNGFTAVETAPEGWWYSAPLPSARLVVMLMTDADICRSRGLGCSGAWEAALERTLLTRERVIGARPREQPRVWVASSQRLRRSAAPGPWLAVGDAGLAVDPVTGSGVVRALRSAEGAADAIEQWLSSGDDRVVQQLERARDAETTQYLLERLQYYAQETRWCDAPFWARRLRVAA